MPIWSNLVHDRQVALGVLEHDKNFRHFVEHVLPDLLHSIAAEKLTLQRLMEAQHRCVEELYKNTHFSHPGFEKVRRGLSEYANADVLLETLGIPEWVYWQKRPGLTDGELHEVYDGTWTVRDLLHRRPAVILGPLFRPNTFLN